jgi:hypothetical protein
MDLRLSRPEMRTRLKSESFRIVYGFFGNLASSEVGSNSDRSPNLVPVTVCTIRR